jgi:hypothetical protein
MRMQISRVTNSSLGSSLSSVPEFEMSGVLSEWLFAVGFWRNFNATHGTMFDQFEEDDADETVVRSITFALADQMQLLEGRPEEVLEFAYRRNFDGSSIMASIARVDLIAELEALRHFLLQSAERHSALTFSL